MVGGYQVLAVSFGILGSRDVWGLWGFTFFVPCNSTQPTHEFRVDRGQQQVLQVAPKPVLLPSSHPSGLQNVLYSKNIRKNMWFGKKWPKLCVHESLWNCIGTIRSQVPV